MNDLLETKKPSLVVLTEHGLRSEELTSTRINGYTLIGGFSREVSRKGGVAIYVNDNLGNTVENLDISDKTIEKVCEICMVRISLGKTQFYLMGVYRPPNSNLDIALDTLSETLDKIPTWKCPVVVMGDINIDDLSENIGKKELRNMLTSHNIRRLGLPPTRVTYNTSTSIDFICTNMNNEDIQSEVITTGLSDHTAQVCHINLQTQNKVLPNSTKRLFSQTNLNHLKQVLRDESWQNVLNVLDVDESYNNFNHTLNWALNVTCPLMKSRPRRRFNHKTTDQEASRLKYIYLQALENEVRSGVLADKEITAQAKKEYDLRLKHLRKEATSNFIQNAENKQKAVWSIINYERCKNSESTKPIELTVDNRLIKDPLLVAEHLNNHFSTVAEKALSNRQMPNLEKEPPVLANTPELILNPTTVSEISKIILDLKTKPSSGLDEISSKLLKHCKEEIIIPLTYIVNLSFKEGVFPNALKKSKVIPKFKKGDTTLVENYRPISLLSTISKVIEKAMLVRLMSHLINNNILSTQQHGFLKGRSTITALTSLVEHIIDQIEEGASVTGFLLDFSKAFDTLDHSLLLNKMKTMGIKGNAAKWFSSYLTNRTQIVELMYTKKNTTSIARSPSLPITRGVPQGSVMGPILFILFTNDLPKYLHEYGQTMMYADDTALLVTEKQTNRLEISSFVTFNMAKQYCHQNYLILNENKTQQLNFGNRTTELPGLPDLELKSEAKYLGVTIDNKLTWTSHVDQLCGQLNTSLYALKRIKSSSDQETAKIAYYSLFESHIRYGLIVWGNSSARNVQRILVLQKKAVRTLLGLNPYDTCRGAFEELKILTVVSLYILEVVKHAIAKFQQKLGDSHQYNTRNTTNFAMPIHHLTLYEKKPCYAGARLFNLLPEQLKRIHQERNFKKHLTKWLLEHSFYTLEEFVTWRNT